MMDDKMKDRVRDKMSDALTVTCDCGKQLQVPFSALETRSKCPHCGNTFTPSEKIKRTQTAERAGRGFKQQKYHQERLENIPNTKGFICPNPKCNFQGKCVAAGASGIVAPLIVAVVAVGALVSWIPLSMVGIITTKDLAGPWMAGIGFIVLLVGTVAAVTVFVTRVAIAATPRWYCPNCGTRLR